MKHEEFINLMAEESILSYMRGIDFISIPTMVKNFKREDERYWGCVFTLETSSPYIMNNRTELLSTMYLMTLVGTRVDDLFMTNPYTINTKLAFLTVYNEVIVKHLATALSTLIETFKSDMDIYFNSIGNIQFDWYRIDDRMVDELNLNLPVDESDITFTVNDFIGNTVETIENETQEVIKVLANHNDIISSDEGVSDTTWEKLFSACDNIQERLRQLVNNVLIETKEKCDKYMMEKLNNLRACTDDVNTELIIAVNIEEIKLYLYREIEDYVNNLGNTIIDTIELRKGNMKLMMKHMKY